MTGGNYRISTDILWQKKSKKPGRTYSLNGAVNLSDNNSDSNIASINNIYFPFTSSQRLLQNQIGSNDGLFYLSLIHI